MNTNRMPSNFSDILKTEGVSLQSDGVADVALTPNAAQRAIALLRSAGIAITGGEIWEKKGDRFFPTYDIWNVEEADYSSREKYIQASLDIADRQVQKYLKAGEHVFVTLGI